MTDPIPSSSPAIADSALTPGWLEGLRELHVAATPGPWERDGTEFEAAGELIGEIFAEDSRPRSGDDAELIVQVRNALPGLLGEVEFGRMMTESYLEASKRFDNLCMDLFRRVAAGASMAEVVDLIGDYMDGCDRVDDESLAAFNAAKAAADPASPLPHPEGEQ